MTCSRQMPPFDAKAQSSVSSAGPENRFGTNEARPLLRTDISRRNHHSQAAFQFVHCIGEWVNTFDWPFGHEIRIFRRDWPRPNEYQLNLK